MKKKGTSGDKALCSPHLEGGHPDQGSRPGWLVQDALCCLRWSAGWAKVFIYVGPLEPCLPEKIPG